MNNLLIGIIIILTFIIQVTVKAQYLNELKLKENKTALSELKKSFDNPKVPALAGVLSFIVPGVGIGQLYNEQPMKMFIHASITAACIIAALLIGPHTNIVEPAPGNTPFIITFMVFTGNWIWSIVDAVISANNINRKAEMKKSRTNVMDKFNFGITVNKNNQLNLKFAFDL